LTAALKKNGLDIDALLQRSRIYLASGKYTEAETDLHQVLHFRNESAEAHYLLAKVGRGREDAAMQKDELGQTLRLDSVCSRPASSWPGYCLRIGARNPRYNSWMEPRQTRREAFPLCAADWALLTLGQKAEARKGVDQLLRPAKSGSLVAGRHSEAGPERLCRCTGLGRARSQPEPGRSTGAGLAGAKLCGAETVAIGVQKAREHALRQPASAPVQMFLGRLLAASGDRAGARKAFEAANAAKPGLVTAELALADMDTAKASGTMPASGFPRSFPHTPAAFPAICCSHSWRRSRGTTRRPSSNTAKGWRWTKRTSSA